MKYRLWLLIGLTIMMGLSSCNEDKILFGGNQLVKSINITGQDFQSGEPETKAAYMVDGTGFHFSWTEGDTVGIYPVGGDQVAFPISSGEGSQTAQFDGGAWALRSSYSYAAYYPYVKGNYMVDETKIPVSFIGQTQNGNGSLDCLDRFDYQASLATNPDVDGNVNIELKHLGCFVRFQLAMPIADTYKSITLTSNKTPIITSGTFDLTKDIIAITPNTSSSTITISLNNTSTTGDNKVLTVFVMLAPSDLSNSEIGISIEGLTYKSYTATVSGKKMIAGKAYSYSAKVQSGTKINGSDVEWDDEGNEILQIPSYWISDGNGNYYVDLGLNVLWATCNVGAKKPADFGDYYSWGEIETKSTYNTWSTYKWSNEDGSILTKYNTKSRYGTVDNKMTLDPEDDISHVMWGGDWRIPTMDELDELCNNCTWIWYDSDNSDFGGVPGYKIMSKKTGYTDHFIFIPAAGYYGYGSLEGVGSLGYYWSSSLDTDNPFKVGKCYFDLRNHYTNLDIRAYGFAIRPVCPLKREYVDLGLSVKWATCNVGALRPEEYGDYYAWGDTVPYYEAGYAQENPQAHWKNYKTAGYTWTNYRFRTSGDSWNNVKFSKYNTSSSYGPTDNDTTLDPEDDVAHVKWGGSWRMPSKAEQDDLRSKCTWTWYSSGNIEFNGVAGYKVTSNIEGYTDRFIFLPAAGSRGDTRLLNVGSAGYYWSRLLGEDGPYSACHLCFDFNSGYLYWANGSRFAGQSVRPVCP